MTERLRDVPFHIKAMDLHGFVEYAKRKVEMNDDTDPPELLMWILFDAIRRLDPEEPR